MPASAAISDFPNKYQPYNWFVVTKRNHQILLTWMSLVKRLAVRTVQINLGSFKGDFWNTLLESENKWQKAESVSIPLSSNIVLVFCLFLKTFKMKTYVLYFLNIHFQLCWWNWRKDQSKRRRLEENRGISKNKNGTKISENGRKRNQTKTNWQIKWRQKIQGIFSKAQD